MGKTNFLKIRVRFLFLVFIVLIDGAMPAIGADRFVPTGSPGAKIDTVLPPGATNDWWSNVQATIKQQEYFITWTDQTPLKDLGACYQAPNRAQGFVTYFTESGVRVTRSEEGSPSWEWGLELSRWGYEGAYREAAPATIHVSSNRVDLDRGGVKEWYLNDERGLEQGFIIAAPLPSSLQSSADGTQHVLFLDLALTGNLQPRIAEDGQAVDFYPPDGNVGVIHYARLKVTDADGRELPSRFEGFCTGGVGGVRIRIDDSKAAYPINVDPLASSPAWTATGESGGVFLGSCVATAGDVNGDGYSDVVVGAFGYSSYSGKAYLYLGGSSGLSATPSWTASGEYANDAFGGSVATAGDVNGDGYSDVVVGAYGYNGTTGKAYLYLGSTSGLSGTAAWTATGVGSSENFGSSVATAGDVNGDGYSDVLVEALGDSLYANLYLGGSSGLSMIPSWAMPGGSVATAGDVNGDGYSDVVVGVPGYFFTTGRVYLYLGSAAGLSGTAAWTAIGETEDDNFGRSVATAGDVNGDGYSDILVGAWAYSGNTGKTYLYLGSASGLSATAAWTAIGENPGDYFGNTVAVVGDVNGDGYSDVVVGARKNNGETGKAYLYLGSASGLSGTAAWTAIGENPGDQFGNSAAAAGDVNGDGYSDVVIGAYVYSGEIGKAYLYHGGPSGLSAIASWFSPGEGPSDYFGCSVAPAGDVNGDGYADAIVGEYGYAGNTGKVYVLYGGPSGFSWAYFWSTTGEAGGDKFGWSVATAGDVNGDGYADVVIGAPGYNGSTGKMYLYLGGPSGLSAIASSSFAGEGPANYFGYSLATAGDVNGDGYADLIVGAYGYNSLTGKAYLFVGGPASFSATPSWTKTGENPGDKFGYSVASAGDINGDGYSEAVIGAPYYSGAAGKAYAYLGGPSGLSATPFWTKTGEAANNLFGICVAAGGDMDGNGHSDVLVGADGYGNNAGRAYLYSGGPSGLSTTASWTATGEAANNYFGAALATAGDVNGDGYSDIAVGSCCYNSITGKVYVYQGGPSGLPASPSWTKVGEFTGNFFGGAVAAAGDVNGDGYGDLMVGAPWYNNGNLDAGAAYLYYGNGGAGMPALPRQLRAGGTVPIAPLGLALDGQYRIGLHLRSPFGRGRVKMEWQAVPESESFNPFWNPIQAGILWRDSLVNGLDRTELIDLGAEMGPFKWRARTRYYPATNPFQSHGPWFTLAANGLQEMDLRSLPAVPCEVPDEPCWLYSVTKSGTDYTLNWQDPNQANQRTGWNIRRANNPALPTSTWPLVGSNVVDMDEIAPNYQWTDHSADDPGPGGVWYFEVTTYNANCPAEGPF